MIDGIGVVAIGRNEGERLRACLMSAVRDCAAVVYVDSGSTDGSRELAEGLGVKVVNLDLAMPFTAARARNEGFAELKRIAPVLQAVQFMDGDCEMIDGWIGKAANALDADPKNAVVCGRRRERFPSASIYNRLCDLEWNTPIGVAKACGGDALIRVSAFEDVGGYNAMVIAGEEPEMCVRLREKGWIIQRIDAEMTLHDAAMTRFGQWWKRNVRAGHAYAQGFAMHGKPPESFRAKEVRSIDMWGVWPWAVSIMVVCLLLVVRPAWCGLGLLPVLLYAALAGRVAMNRRGRGASMREAILYGASVAVGKLPQWLGVFQFRSAQRRGVRSEIIEYKQPSPR